MTKGEVITLVLNRCGRRADDTVLAGFMSTEFDNLLNSLEQGVQLAGGGTFYPWFLLSQAETAYTVAGESRIQLPPNFIDEYEDGALWVRATTADEWTELVKEELDDLEKKYGSVASTAWDMPVAYAITSQEWRLFPVPDQAYQLRTFVYRGVADMADTDSSVWTTDGLQLVVASLGEICAKFYLYNAALGQTFELAVAKEAARLHTLSVARDMSNREPYVGPS